MAIGRNLVAALSSSLWIALLGLVMVPVYLKYLGVESYGLIGFFMTTQALFQLLDMGIASTINREVARCSASGNYQRARNLLSSLAVVYWVIAVLIALLMLLFSPIIASYWLNSEQLSTQTLGQVVMLIGVVIACRWPIALYQGALIGAQRLAVSSLINMVVVTISSAGSILVLLYVSSTIQAFFIWQAFVGVMHVLIMRFFAWKVVGRAVDARFDIALVMNIRHFTAGVGAVSIMGIIFTQLDKLLLSRLLGLESFSHYMLASVVAGSLYVVVGPVYNIVYSRFSSLVVNGSASDIAKMLSFSTRGLSLFLFPIAMMLIVCSKEIVVIWTGSEELGSAVGPLVSILVVGVALNGVMMVPHALQLALGFTQIPLFINGILLALIVPLIVCLALSFGVLGGALAWLVFNVLYVCLCACFMSGKAVVSGVGGWLLKDILLPFSLVSLVGFFTIEFYSYTTFSAWVKIGISAAQVVVMFALGILVTPHFFMIAKRLVSDARRWAFF